MDTQYAVMMAHNYYIRFNTNQQTVLIFGTTEIRCSLHNLNFYNLMKL